MGRDSSQAGSGSVHAVLAQLSSGSGSGQAPGQAQPRASSGRLPALSSRAGMKADQRAGKCWGPHTQLHHTYIPKTQAQMKSRV